MKTLYDRLNKNLRGKTLVDVLVLYRNWTYGHEWWFPLAFAILAITIILCLVITNIWPWIASLGTAIFLFMWGIPMWTEYIMDENDQPSKTASKMLTWGNVIVVLMSLLFIDIFVALAHNPPQVGHALFCAVLFIAGVLFLWFEYRINQKDNVLSHDDEEE